MALTNAVYRLYFDYKTEDQQKTYLGTTFIAICFISGFFLSLMFIFSPIIGKVYGSIEFYPYYSLFIIATFLSVFFEIPKIIFQVKQKGVSFFLISLLEFLLTTGLTIWFLVVRKGAAKGVLEATLYANVLILPVFIYVTFKHIKPAFSFPILKKALIFALPTVPVTISYWIINLSDRIFIEKYFDLNEVGIYSIANKLAEVSVVVVGALASAYNPVFFELAQSPNQEQAKKQVNNFMNLYIIISGFISFGIAFFAPEIIYLFVDSKYSEGAKILPLLCLANYISIISGLFNWMIMQEKKTFQMMIIVLITASFNIALNFLLIKEYGMYGAAWATVSAFLLSFVLKYYYAKKCWYVPTNWLSVWFVTIIFITIFIITDYLYIQNIFFVSLKIVFIIIISVLLAIKFKDKIKNIFDIMKRKKNTT